MKRVLVFFFVPIAIGCTRDVVPKEIEAKAIEIANRLAQPNLQSGEDVDALMTSIMALPDARLKATCLRSFVDKILAIDVSQPSQDMNDQRKIAGEVIMLCKSRIVSKMSEAGGTIEDAWYVYISLLSWMQVQMAKLYGDGKIPRGVARTEGGGLRIFDNEAFLIYSERSFTCKWIAGWYDNLLNRMERQFPDPNDGKIDTKQIAVLKNRIEKFLGRPMRTPEQCVEDWKCKKSELCKWTR